MVNGRTSSGFEFAIDERRVKSWTVVKKVAAMQKAQSDVEVYGIAIELIGDLLGEDQEQRLVDHVTQVYGYDDAEIISKEFFEIIGSARNNDEVKNFSSSQAASQPVGMSSPVTLQKPMGSMNTPPTNPNLLQFSPPV